MILDAGVLIAAEQNEHRWVTLLKVARDDELRLRVPAAVVAQVWRGGGPQQAGLARALKQVEVEPLTGLRARRAGELCARNESSDVVDASVAALAEEYERDLVTTDPDDLRPLAEHATGTWTVREF